MDVNNIRIITLGNMQGKGDLMLKPASKNEPEKLFVRKGSTTIFHKLADKIRGIKQAPYSVKLSLDSIFTEKNILLKNLKNKSIKEGEYIKTTYDSGSNNPVITLRNEKPIIFASKSLSELQIELMDHSNSSNIPTSTQIKPTVIKNDPGPPAPIDDVGPPPPNYKPIPPDIKQIHIANLKKAIDFDGMQFDKTKPNYEQLNIQKEFVETTIKLIASASTLKKSERIAEGRGSLSNLKLELNREFQNLMIMAENNGYKTENRIKKTADLNNTLRSIDFIQEKKSSWF